MGATSVTGTGLGSSNGLKKPFNNSSCGSSSKTTEAKEKNPKKTYCYSTTLSLPSVKNISISSKASVKICK